MARLVRLHASPISFAFTRPPYDETVYFLHFHFCVLARDMTKCISISTPHAARSWSAGRCPARLVECSPALATAVLADSVAGQIPSVVGAPGNCYWNPLKLACILAAYSARCLCRPVFVGPLSSRLAPDPSSSHALTHTCGSTAESMAEKPSHAIVCAIGG